MNELLSLIADPAAWAALITLVVMEVVLGIDNLVFISILTNKLPEAQRPKARRIGIGLALWCRYEAAAILVMATGGDLFLRAMEGHAAWRDGRTQSMVFTLVLPSVFLLSLWLYFNWQAQGDPLFFYRGPYSINAAPDVARNAPDHPLTYAYRHPVGAAAYVV